MRRRVSWLLAAVTLLAVIFSTGAWAGDVVKVKCGSTDLQKAIDSAESGAILELEGICAADVVVEGKALTLRGAATPGPHGIQGQGTRTRALELVYSQGTVLENLSISNGTLAGVGASFSSFTMTDCETSGNAGGTGVTLLQGSRLTATRLRSDNNGFQGVQAFGNSRIYCEACDVNNNGSWVARSGDGSLVTLVDSVAAGTRGLLSLRSSYIDIDCVSVDTPHACGLNASRTALWVFADGEGALFGAGDFTGQVIAQDRAKASFLGARQQSTGTGPGGNPLDNQVHDFAQLVVDPIADLGGVVHQSRLLGTTHLSGFSRALVRGASVLDGTVNCDETSDAWADSGVDLTNGTFNGCEHAP